MHSRPITALVWSILILKICQPLLASEVDDIGSWKNINLNRPAIYQPLMLPSLNELLAQHPSSKVNRLVIMPGWGYPFAFTTFTDSKGRHSVLIDSRSELQKGLVFRVQMPAGQDFERVMQIIQEFEVSMNWKSNAGDKVGDDESMILFEHYETIKQGYVIKRRVAMPDPVQKLIDELDEIQKKIFKEVQQN